RRGRATHSVFLRRRKSRRTALMTRWHLSLLALLAALIPSSAWLRAADPQPVYANDKGTYLGALFSTSDRGVVVTHIIPGSPAEKAGIQRNDLVLKYGAEEIRDGDRLARLICAGKPGDRVKLSLQRDGKKVETEATLELGLALRFANPTPVPSSGSET